MTSGYFYSAVIVDYNPSLLPCINHKKPLSKTRNTPMSSQIASGYFHCAVAMFRCKMRESIVRVVAIPDWSKEFFLDILMRYFYIDMALL